jgi:TPP-dependent pyruvate/acetoin dehydrogenase alpha subunit
MALAEKYRKSGAITIAFLGDGTLGEGVVYESLNMAALWGVPILYILENNRIAQTTPIYSAVAGSIAQRFNAFGIESHQLETTDVLEIMPVAEKLIKEVREGCTPIALLIKSYRFGPHSKGDDTRDPQIMDEIRREHDPVQIQRKRLDKQGIEGIRAEVDNEVDAALKKALEAPFPSFNQPQNLP